MISTTVTTTSRMRLLRLSMVRWISSRAIVDGNDLDAGRQAGLDLLELRLDAIDHFERVLALRMTTMPETTSPSPFRSATPRRRSGPVTTSPTSLTRTGAPASGLANDDVLEIVGRVRVAAAAHHVLGAAELDQAPAGLVVAAAHRVDHLADGDAVALQAGWDRRSPGTAARSRRAAPPRPRRARPAGDSAGTSPDTSAAPRGCACRSHRPARTGRPSRGRWHPGQVRSSRLREAAGNAGEIFRACASAPSRCRCRRRR